MDYLAPRDGLVTAECTLEHVRYLLAAPRRWQREGPVHDRFGQFERHPVTTHADVLALLDKAIALLPRS